jgi:hypothetical protein
MEQYVLSYSGCGKVTITLQSFKKQTGSTDYKTSGASLLGFYVYLLDEKQGKSIFLYRLACCRSFYRLARLSFQREHDKSKLQEKI